jgi:hypothetical protein
MDICFHVANGPAYGEYLNYFGNWVNMGYTKSWYLPAKSQWIEIQDEAEWEQADINYTGKCLRYAEWRPL